MQIRIGTRKSPLALAQAEEVRQNLAEAWPDLAIEIVPMTTSGDKITDKPLADAGGKGLFTKELEDALLDGRIDIAVHSMKDMQTALPDGLMIGCMLEREDPRDMLVGKGITSLDDLPRGATFGTSSLRRSAQMLMRRPDVTIMPLRGNVQTRLAKIEKGEVQATMLAVAGLNRLGLFDVPGFILPWEDFLPAVAQGAIGIECRADDDDILEKLAPLADIDTENAVNCERAFLRMLDGSCRTPIAGYAAINVKGQISKGKKKEPSPSELWQLTSSAQQILHFLGLIVKPDGSASHQVEISGDARDAETLGNAAGKQLLQKAGKDFLA